MFLILQKYTIIRKNVHFPCIYFIRWGVVVRAIFRKSVIFYEKVGNFCFLKLARSFCLFKVNVKTDDTICP